MAFGGNMPDQNLVPGWDVQGNAPAGYGQAGNSTTVLTGGQLGAGYPSPPGAGNANASENSASYTTSVLANAGYADATGPATRTLPATIGGTSLASPALGTTGTNPSNSLAALVTGIAPTPTSVTIKNNAGVTVSTALNGAGPYTVPPGGSITLNAAATAWTWSV